MKAAQMTREDEIRSISQKYEMDKEKVRDILKEVFAMQMRTKRRFLPA